MSTPRPGRRRSGVALTAASVAFVMAVPLALGIGARPVAAGTAETMEAAILSWVNGARAERSLPPLQGRADVADLAGDRAATLAAAGVLSHDAAGCLSCQLDARGITWHLYGETLGTSSYAWGMDAATSLFNAFAASPSHWDALMGAGFDTAGVGAVYRDADGSTYLSIVLIDGDGTSPAPAPKPTHAQPRAPAPAPAPTPAPVLGAAIALLAGLDVRVSLVELTSERLRLGSRFWRLAVIG
jgi:uncharacterized protein YkwD